MQAHDPRLKQNIPYVVSFMCAGTPSLHGTEQVLDQLGVEREDVTSFRYRGDGWPGLTKATLSGDARTMTYNDSWGKVLNRHLQTRCKICRTASASSPISSADGWEGDEKGYPSFEERDGNSLILIRTDKGRELFRNAEADGVVQAEAFDTAGIFAIRPFQYYRRTTILPRLWAMKLLMLKNAQLQGLRAGQGDQRNRPLPELQGVHRSAGTAQMKRRTLESRMKRPCGQGTQT
ncbi:Coenzyme F420 hydrogenase OS=Stutzerimonas stutzeri OX=316 GN=CXK95_16365 PE=4 SV=1 [Stutzerimonas stutzeri]